jgi:hypothetical protein
MGPVIFDYNYLILLSVIQFSGGHYTILMNKMMSLESGVTFPALRRRNPKMLHCMRIPENNVIKDLKV